MFLLSDTSSNQEEGTSTALHSRTSNTTATEEPEINTTMVDEDEITGESSTSLPQVSEPTRAIPPQTLLPPPLVNQPSAVTFQSAGGNPGLSAPPQSLETPGFIVPREIFPPPRSLEPAKSYHANVPPTVTKSPATTHTVPGSSQPIAPNQVDVSPVVHDLGRLVAPILESSKTITPNQTAVSPVVREPSLLVTPVLESPQVVAPNRTLNSAAVHESPPLVAPFPILQSCQPVTTNQVAVSPIVHKSPLVNPSSILESSQAVAPQQAVVSPKPVSPPQAIDPHVIHTPQPAVAHGSSELTGGIAGDSSGVTVATRNVYRPRDGGGAVDTNRPRRSSIEGAPDVMLSLGGSGYQLIDPSPQRDMSISTPPPTTPSSVSPPDELIVPSSQQSLEEYLTIPVEVESVIPTSPSPSAGELIDHSSQQPVGRPPTTSAASEITITPSGRLHFAPRVVPTYSIDRSDFPSWFVECGRLDFVLAVEAGEIWKMLITTWLRQERRLGFGLNEELVSEIAFKVRILSRSNPTS